MTNDTINLSDFENDINKKTSSGINVLTILTFIGCAIELFSVLKNFISGKQALLDFEKNQDKLANAPAWAKKLAGPEVYEMMVKSLENRIPLFIIGLIAIALCVFGALEMRKLKKQGFIIWLIGELLPLIGLLVFVGSAFINSPFIYFSLIIPIIFITLYLFQRKNLIY